VLLLFVVVEFFFVVVRHFADFTEIRSRGADGQVVHHPSQTPILLKTLVAHQQVQVFESVPVAN